MQIKMRTYDHYKTVPQIAKKIGYKKKKPHLMAVVDEDSCTGCQVCVPFCPVDCIELVPKEKYNIYLFHQYISGLMNVLVVKYVQEFAVS